MTLADRQRLIDRIAGLLLFLALAVAAVNTWGCADRALAALPPGGVAAVLGLPGSGKSELVRRVAARWDRVLTFDPYARRDRLGGRKFRRATAGELVSPRELFAAPSFLDRRRFAMVVGPVDLSSTALGRDFAAVGELSWLTGGISLVAEEAALYSRQAEALLLRVATGGGHAGLRLVLLSQSLGRIQIDARRGISLVIAGAQAEDGDLRALARRCGTAFADRVKTLRPAEFHSSGRLIRPPDPPAVWPERKA